MNSFTSLSLSSKMIRNLDHLGYTEMTPIQAASLPLLLDGKDLLGQAKTGSGKTAAFSIAMLSKLNPERYRIQGLVLCPTRELAEQVSHEMRSIAKFRHNIKILTITGGMPQHRQEHSLKHQAHIVVGTPGRILKLISRGTLILDEITSLVLDEADRMLDMGFIDQIREILSQAPRRRQTLLFSATFPEEIKKLAAEFMNKPETAIVESLHKEATISQSFYTCSWEDKPEQAIRILAKYRPETALIFCNTKDGCRRTEEELNRRGILCAALHGDLEQKERTETLIRFANRSVRVLVATDIAARGLDIDDLSLVINFDLPFETETYIHRIGRTGRAGLRGRAVSLMSPREEFRLDAVNSLLQTDFSTETANFPDAPSFRMEPEMVTLSINGGRKNKVGPGDILGVLTAGQRLPGSDVGKIDRLETLSFVAVKRASADWALSILSKEKIKGRRFKAILHDAPLD